MTSPPPDTMIAPKTGEPLTRGVRPFVVTDLDQTITVDRPGYDPASEGEGVHVGSDKPVVEEALRAPTVAAGDD